MFVIVVPVKTELFHKPELFNLLSGPEGFLHPQFVAVTTNKSLAKCKGSEPSSMHSTDLVLSKRAINRCQSVRTYWPQSFILANKTHSLFDDMGAGISSITYFSPGWSNMDEICITI